MFMRAPYIRVMKSISVAAFIVHWIKIDNYSKSAWCGVRLWLECHLCRDWSWVGRKKWNENSSRMCCAFHWTFNVELKAIFSRQRAREREGDRNEVSTWERLRGSPGLHLRQVGFSWNSIRNERFTEQFFIMESDKWKDLDSEKAFVKGEKFKLTFCNRGIKS